MTASLVPKRAEALFHWILDHLSTDPSGKTSDEEVLNVLRNAFQENDELILGTSDIAEHVNVGDDAARGYLDDLESEGRIIKHQIGSKESSTAAWGLHPDERRRPVNPCVDRLGAWSHKSRRLGERIFHRGELLWLLGAALMIMAYSSTLPNALLEFQQAGTVRFIGFCIVGLAGLSYCLAGGLAYLPILMERGGVWLKTTSSGGEDE